jgi:zinc protease
LAVQASAYASGSELASEFIVQARAVPGQRLDSTEARLRRTLVEFARTGASAAAVQRFKASREAGLVNSLVSVSGKVSQLAANQTFTGNPNYLKIEQQRLQALTPADVRRVFAKYLRGKYAVVLSVVPKGKPELVAHTTYTADAAGYQVPKDEYAGLRYVKAQDSFDRSQQPKSGPNPVVQVPALWEETFANGLKLVGTRNAEMPSVTLLLTIRGGHRLEQNAPTKAGLAALTASMLNEGTTQYTGEQLGAALDRLGSFIRVGTSDENTSISVQSLTKNLPATLALLQEVLLHPRFDAADFDRLKKQTLEGLANQAIQPVTIANTTYSRLLYGSANIMSVPINGTPASVGSLTLDDVNAFYAATAVS